MFSDSLCTGYQMNKIVGGDYVGYHLTLELKGVRLKCGSNTIHIVRDDVVKMEVLDSKTSTSGTRMAAKSYMFSKLGIGSLWGGLSAKSKSKLLVSIVLRNGKSFLVETDDSEYSSILKKLY